MANFPGTIIAVIVGTVIGNTIFTTIVAFAEACQ